MTDTSPPFIAPQKKDYAAGKAPLGGLFLSQNGEKKILQEGRHLRLTIKSGGCSGMRAIFSFDEESLDCAHRRIPVRSLTAEKEFWVLVDPLSWAFVQGAVIDYQEEIMVSQFVLRHPKASHQCGCGESFALE